MIISCPACDSRFNIDPDRVPAGGRQVRCGKCGNVWRIAADGGSIPAAADSPPAPESADVGRPPGLFGKSPPATDGMSAGENGSPAAATSDNAADAAQESENGAGEAGEADQAGAGNGASSAPPLLGSKITPNARQKLAEARKGRSRVRFLVIALVLMIVAVIAVSFITGSDGLNEALRNVPGLDAGGGEGIVDENAVGAGQ